MKREQLWAPWRLAYIQGQIKNDPPPAPLALLPGGDPDCFLCRGAVDDHDRENLVVHRGLHAVTVLNRYPYNNGHLLLAPLRHQGQLEDLTPDEQAEILHTMTRMVRVLGHLLGSDGFNIGLNLGRAAGAGVPGHLHWHIVPRWIGDTNFMPVTTGVDVVSQSLDALWDMLREALASS